MKNIIAAAILAATLIPAAHASHLITEADCSMAQRLNQKNMSSGGTFTFEQKTIYAYAEACENAGLITLPMSEKFLDTEDATPEVEKYCQDHAPTRGDYAVCMKTGHVPGDDQ